MDSTVINDSALRALPPTCNHTIYDSYSWNGNVIVDTQSDGQVNITVALVNTSNWHNDINTTMLYYYSNCEELFCNVGSVDSGTYYVIVQLRRNVTNELLASRSQVLVVN